MNTENNKDMEQLLQSEIDLGDDFPEIDPGFDPFADDAAEETAETTAADTAAEATTQDAAVTETVTEKAAEKEEKAVDSDESTADEQEASDEGGKSDNVNPFEAEMDRVETKQAEETKTGLLNKAPVFEYAGVSEEITDLSKTFEELRAAKAEDFPELEDANRVTWKMNYCGIVKNVAQPKKTTIEEQKKQIEESKDFANAIKRKKGEFVCKVTPTVTAQKKGRMPIYKGVFLDEETAAVSGKAIAYVPSEDGNVYEIRNNAIGTFRARADYIRGLSHIRAGFTPALPLFPYDELKKVIAFFRYYADRKKRCEALVNVYWDKDAEEYVLKVPEQKVGPVAVETVLSEENDNLLHVMDIHSHNYMPAVFSEIDNKDEKATRLYTVIGRLDRLMPEISTRVSVGGKYVDVNPADIFQYPFDDFPSEWIDKVSEGGDRT